MKKIVQAWTGISLVQRIVAGLVIGALLGMFVSVRRRDRHFR